MKLMCNAVVEPLHGQVTNKRFLKSCLSIGRQSVKNDNVYLLLQQEKINKNGTRYKVKDNILEVFTKFVNEGKTTIRFIEPHEDLIIKSDPIQLKSFLHVLKQSLSNKVNPAVMNLSNLDPKKLGPVSKTKVVIRSSASYPVLEGFPRTTEILLLAGLERKSFDRQILKLQSLQILNLSDNQLTSLPQELGMLPNLRELILANNQLGKSPISKWSWMSGSKISKNLKLLNISSNELKTLPYQINKLQGLVSLFLNNNLIPSLNQGIGNLTNLKFLNIAKNYLTFLPGSFRLLRLVELDISENPLRSTYNKVFECHLKVTSLLDFAAQTVIRNRIYYDASVIPFHLVPYLDKTNYCLCGTACFGSYQKTFRLGRFNIAKDTKYSGITGHEILYECYFCSSRCIRLYKNSL